MIKQGFSSCSTDERSVVSKAEVMYDYALLLDTLRKKNLRQLRFMSLVAHRFGYPGKLTGVSGCTGLNQSSSVNTVFVSLLRLTMPCSCCDSSLRSTSCTSLPTVLELAGTDMSSMLSDQQQT